MSQYREKAEHAWTEDSVRLILTPSLFAKASLFHVQEAGHFRALPAYYTERENLDSYLIVYTAAGKGMLTYRNQSYTLTPGHVFFIDCMENQCYATDSAGGWELLWAHVNGPAIRAYYDLFQSGGGPVRPLAEESQIPVLLRELLEVHRHRSVRNEMMASKTITGLLTELVLQGRDADPAETEFPAHIAGALRTIDKRYGEKLTLDGLSRLFSVNKYQFAKDFKRFTGYSPGEYVINTRISRAKELLKYSDLPVSEIAERVGIGNVSHFINLFRDRVGHTPLGFRKRWQQPGK